MKQWIGLGIVALFLAGCASTSTSRFASGSGPKAIGNRRIVLLRNSVLVVNPVLAQSSYKSFAKDGISDKEFNRRIDSIFLTTVRRGAEKVGMQVDDSTRCDSARSLPLADGRGSIFVALPSQFPNDSVLYLVVGVLAYDIDGLYNPGGGPIFLRAQCKYALYDPKLGATLVDGRISVHSSSLLGHMIAQSDWYADVRKTGDEILSQIAEFR